MPLRKTGLHKSHIFSRYQQFPACNVDIHELGSCYSLMKYITGVSIAGVFQKSKWNLLHKKITKELALIAWQC